ncbi:MAG: Ig domain-containing protein [Lachnospiraceae bacterium]|nr:Ig domain-containing protein [Lachnospiraceae bacterium]
MKKILRYGLVYLLVVTILPIISSCGDDDISSDVTEIVYPTYVSLEVPDDLQEYIYTDATGAKTLPMLKGNTATLEYSMSDDATYRDIVWESSNADVATVDENGFVTAVSGAGTGYSIITVHPAVFFSGSGIAGTLKVLVSDELVPVSSVTINYEERDEYYEGDVLQLNFALLPATSTYKTVKWSTSDSETATVDLNGKVSFLKYGDVTITATSMDGSVSDSKTFNVLSGTAPSSVSFINTEDLQHLAYGQKINLKKYVKMEPEYATFSMIEWSDTDGLISVDGNGVMTVKYTGTTAVMKMTGHTIELVASDRNGNKL